MRDQLDVLLDEALAHAAKFRTKKLPSTKDRLEQLKEKFNEVYANPENWSRTRGIAIIHRAADGSLTLLGNFSEFLFKKQVSTRKLCRESQPIAVSSEEYVSGDWWLTYKPTPFKAEANMIEYREIKMDIELGELQVYAKDATVRVRLHHQWIERVELTVQTQFVCPTNKILMYFPEGLDVLGGMSFENKIELKTRLEL